MGITSVFTAQFILQFIITLLLYSIKPTFIVTIHSFSKNMFSCHCPVSFFLCATYISLELICNLITDPVSLEWVKPSLTHIGDVVASKKAIKNMLLMSIINKLLQSKGHSKADDNRNEPALFNGLILIWSFSASFLIHTLRPGDVDIRSNTGFSIMSKILWHVHWSSQGSNHQPSNLQMSHSHSTQCEKYISVKGKVKARVELFRFAGVS